MYSCGFNARISIEVSSVIFHSSSSSREHRGQGWRSGESTRLPPMWPEFDSRSRRHLCVEFVVGSFLAPRGFSPGTPVFPSPQKPTLPNSNSIWNARTYVERAPERS